MENKQPITKREFVRSLVAQPFFTWHSLQNEESLVRFDDEFEEITSDPYFIWSNEDTAAKFFPNFTSQRNAKTYDLIKENLIKKLQQRDTVILKGNIEQRIAETKSLIGKNKIIINPVFEYKSAIAKPLAYDDASKTIINLKYAKKVGRIDLLNGYYDYSIISKSVPVEEYLLYYLQKNPQYKKHEIRLDVTNFCYTKKGPDVPNKVISEKEVYFVDTFIKQSFESGTKKIKKVSFPNLEEQIASIEKNRSAKISTYLGSDNTEWGDNPEWNDLLKQIESPYFGMSGRVFKKADIKKDPSKMEIETELEDAVIRLKKPLINPDKLGAFVQLTKAREIVWYDFESFSLPISPCDFVEPNDHVVFQASIIKTTDFEIKSTSNLVFDPANITLQNLEEIIRAIYDPSAQYYIVYNKDFELGRLNSMLNQMDLANYPSHAALSGLVDEIRAKTFDLYEIFRISNNKNFPGVLLPGQKGRTSIKNVEKYLSTINLPLKYKITQYKDLEIKNGLEAMTQAIDRSLEIIDSKTWEKNVPHLKKYCENDVLAMLAVYELVKHLVVSNGIEI